MTCVYNQSNSFYDLDHKENNSATIFNKELPPRILGKSNKISNP